MPLTLIFLCAPAFLVTAAGLLAALVFLSRLRLPKVTRHGVVTLILPLTGEAAGLGALLRAIAAQTLQPRRLLICLESTQDPAYLRARQLARKSQLPIEILIAGAATQSAQKCSNQIAGLERIDAEDEVVVLFDADILPPSWWLSALASPVLDGSADIVTGYRWPMVVGAQRLGAHLTLAIDRGIALLPRPAVFNVTWGGSLALSPQVIAKLDLARLLSETLSDDCAIGEQAGLLGLRVLTRRALLVPTPATLSLASAWLFGRRQYQIIRIYRPQIWWLAFLTLSVRLTAWSILLVNIDQWWARFAVGLLASVALTVAAVQALVGRYLGSADTLGVTLLQLVLALLKPLVDLFHWSLVLGAWNARIVRWGHLSYRVFEPGQVAVTGRRRWH